MKHTQGTCWTQPCIVLPQAQQHTHTFILLHGLGSNGEKFGSELLRTGISSEGRTLRDVFPGAKFIFPTAKWRRSSTFNRTLLTQWFDVYSLDDRSLRQDVQIEGLVDSAAFLRRTLQGCAMSLMVQLSLEFPIGAYVGMSGWLPFRNDIQDILSGAGAPNDDITFGDEESTEQPNGSTQALTFVRDLLELGNLNAKPAEMGNSLATPVFLGHGARDEKVPCGLGEETASVLSLLGVDVTWKRYPELGHWYQIPEELDDIVQFLCAKLKNTTATNLD
jgi:predicted esterase